MGTGGTILHWNGGAWTSTPPPSGHYAPLLDVSGTGPNDVWAVGHGGVLRWDGVSWSTSAIDFAYTLHGVWAGSDRVWVVGAAGAILQRSP